MPQERHPAVEELVAYHGGGLDAAAAERLADHLATCSDCAALVVDLEAFPAVAVGEDGPDEIATRKAWRLLESRLRQERSGRRASGGKRAWQAAAAVLALLSLGLTASLLRLVGENARLERQAELAEAPEPGPEVNVPIVDLFPAAFVRGEAEVEARVTAGSESLVVILNLEDPDGSPSYDLEIVAEGEGGDAPDRQVWSRSGLEPTPFGNVTLVLPASALPSGSYRLVLSAPGSSGAEVAAYTLRVTR